MSKDKQVATRTKAGEVSTGDEFTLTDSMDQVEPRLPQIGIIHQGQLFQMPDGTKEASFEGVILDLNRANAYWEEPFSESGGGTPPDCSSIDGIHADLNVENCPSPTGKCGHGKQPECPKNRFGSAGRGKACKNLKRVHVLIEGQRMPLRLTLPPTSINSIDSYVSVLVSKGLPYQLVNTRFGLKEVSNKEGIKYSETVFDQLEPIKDPVKVEYLRKMYKDWKGVMRGQAIEFDEYH